LLPEGGKFGFQPVDLLQAGFPLLFQRARHNAHGLSAATTQDLSP